MKTWISGQELLVRWEKWNINSYDIVELMLCGELTLYRPSDLTLFNIDDCIKEQIKEEYEFFKVKMGEHLASRYFIDRGG